MLIDNNDIDNFITHRLLKNHGVTNIISFHDADDALLYLKETHVIYHLIIVNIDAAGINGIEFIDRFYESGLEKTQGEVCALSSSDDSAQIINTEKKNIRMISKPLTIDQIMNKVE